MADDPILLATPGRPRAIELAAMRAYRTKHPDGPPWLDLAVQTRCLWVARADAEDKAADPINAGHTSKE